MRAAISVFEPIEALASLQLPADRAVRGVLARRHDDVEQPRVLPDVTRVRARDGCAALGRTGLVRREQGRRAVPVRPRLAGEDVAAGGLLRSNPGPAEVEAHLPLAGPQRDPGVTRSVGRAA